MNACGEASLRAPAQVYPGGRRGLRDSASADRRRRIRAATANSDRPPAPVQMLAQLGKMKAQGESTHRFLLSIH
jgi:hypothetical protein